MGDETTEPDLDDFGDQIKILKNDLLEIRNLIDDLQHVHSIGEAFRGAVEVVEKVSHHESNLIELVDRTLSTSIIHVQESMNSINHQLSEMNKELVGRLSELENRIEILED